MEFLQPATWREALEAKAAHPGAVLIFGGTDVIVEMNFDRGRPEVVIDLRGSRRYKSGGRRREFARGAGVTYARILQSMKSASERSPSSEKERSSIPPECSSAASRNSLWPLSRSCSGRRRQSGSSLKKT